MHCGVMVTGYNPGYAGIPGYEEFLKRQTAVLPAVRAMPTPINPASLGEPFKLGEVER